MNPILEIKNIVKDYPKVRAVDGVSLSIKDGICFGLLGPNGAGKTTLIEIIEGILRSTSGEILYKGRHRKSNFRNEAGIQFQNTQLPEALTVKEVLQTFRNLYSHSLPLDELIEMCELQEILNRDNKKISGGQRQRLFLAIALANDPELIFLDEPTTGLDPQARRHLWDIVNHIKSNKKTIILTTHYMEEAELLCDEIAIMDLGKIIALGPPADLIKKSNSGHLVILRTEIDEQKLTDIPWAWNKNQDRIEIHTDNINECVATLIAKEIDLSTLTIRSQNLEDLFIRLTGKKLRE
ncbi:MAG: ABC transporter ATP-binding protein [Spirochaetes bacterium]|nr:ABC transporter ATP-binding protein [Spirochaetota bacterium]